MPACGRLLLGTLPRRHVYSELALVLGSAMQAHMERNPRLQHAFCLNGVQVCAQSLVHSCSRTHFEEVDLRTTPCMAMGFIVKLVIVPPAQCRVPED